MFNRTITRTLLAAAATTLVAAGVAVAPTPVSAAVGDLVCTASGTTTFSPGLTLTPRTQDIDFDIAYSGCTSTNGATVTSGGRSGSFTGVRGCLTIPPSASGTVVVTWNDSTTSTISGTSQSVDTGGQTVITLTGTVQSGRFAGDEFIEVLTQSSLDLLTCATTGVTTQTAAGALTLA
ncbi:hypothetical protein [Hamadaea tsunoensis]|uniref:hypothetical protein n=1 Tax=Hamadaea tsunoensis TaxID=53368 RepID=UPI00041BC9CA|nr:hypothetical protein [Hamadaea tsunoensis]